MLVIRAKYVHEWLKHAYRTPKISFFVWQPFYEPFWLPFYLLELYAPSPPVPWPFSMLQPYVAWSTFVPAHCKEAGAFALVINKHTPSHIQIKTIQCVHEVLYVVIRIKSYS